MLGMTVGVGLAFPALDAFPLAIVGVIGLDVGDEIVDWPPEMQTPKAANAKMGTDSQQRRSPVFPSLPMKKRRDFMAQLLP